ncbi:cadherin EGF LAG seven-pass G-type receptor 2-like [Mercenaria mercenaria]|uniref:cadherin EGF LAG seven-pass G-type receptor 2-like n=1 Tax=Mercenaria mercenaria TaxID=6596 RepID=UPI00234F49B2|nr:cadherin EGF LAG seven-pass G-type receptor 2-like [Mercenaria mercenaria]
MMFTKAWIVVFLCGSSLYTTDAIGSWNTPSISGSGTGTASTPININEDLAVGPTGTTVEAVATSGTIASYELLTTGSPFSVTSPGGILNLDSALDYETTTSYTLEIKAADTDANTGIATFTIAVGDVNEAPTFTATSFTACVADASTAGQSVTTLTATDQDAGDTIAYSVNSGDTNNHFIFSGAELRVSSGTTLDMSTTASYTLVIHATDDDSSPLIGSATLTVTVGDCNSATALAVSIMMTLMALVVSLY